jgi:hypothetical protein
MAILEKTARLIKDSDSCMCLVEYDVDVDFEQDPETGELGVAVTLVNPRMVDHVPMGDLVEL